jgi:hypothetical protein
VNRSWISVEVTDYQLHNPGLNGLYPSKIIDNVTASFSETLRDLIIGHSWMAKLSHNARRVLRRDNRNFEVVLYHAFKEWAETNRETL